MNPWVYRDTQSTSGYYRPAALSSSQFILVGSFSKTGFAGLRIGYAATVNHEIAQLMEEYIEWNTLGTNTWSQSTLDQTMTSFLGDSTSSSLSSSWNTPFHTFQHQVYVLLQSRNQEIRNLFPSSLIHSNANVPLLFVNLPTSFFERHDILVNPGSSFGMKAEEWCRIQLMVSDEEWQRLIQRISSRVFQQEMRSTFICV